MIVVADTSPINYLVMLGQINALPGLFARVMTSHDVLNELSHPRAPAPVREWASNPPRWLELRRPRDMIRVRRLGPGELSAIALAEEVRGEGSAVRLLIDERDGAREARARGFVVYGTLAVPEAAAERRLLDIRTTLERLRSTSFFADEAILVDIVNRIESRSDMA